MLRATRTAAAAKTRVSVNDLYNKIETNKTTNWRANWAESQKIDAAKVAEVRHAHYTHELGPDYDKVNADNFPYPLVYSMSLTIWFAYMIMYIDYADQRTNMPAHNWNPKNTDGSTVFPEEPVGAWDEVVFPYQINEKAVNPF